METIFFIHAALCRVSAVQRKPRTCARMQKGESPLTRVERSKTFFPLISDSRDEKNNHAASSLHSTDAKVRRRRAATFARPRPDCSQLGGSHAITKLNLENLGGESRKTFPLAAKPRSWAENNFRQTRSLCVFCCPQRPCAPPQPRDHFLPRRNKVQLEAGAAVWRHCFSFVCQRLDVSDAGDE